MPFDKQNIYWITEGDEQKFSNLMENISNSLFLFAMGFVQQREIAEEIVSDIFIKIWENRKNLLEIDNLRAYLFVAVKNACISHIRQKQKENLISLEDFSSFDIPAIEHTESEYIKLEKLKEIQAAIEQLPPKCKMVFTMAKFNGLRYKEIAEILNISEKTVNNHLVFALKRLRQVLGAEK